MIDLRTCGLREATTHTGVRPVGPTISKSSSPIPKRPRIHQGLVDPEDLIAGSSTSRESFNTHAESKAVSNIGQSAKFMIIALMLGLMCGTTGRAEDRPVKVFILAGQSNMEGQGFIKADPQAQRWEGEPGVPDQGPGHGRQVQAPPGRGWPVGRPRRRVDFLPRSQGQADGGLRGQGRPDRAGTGVRPGRRRGLRGTRSAHQTGVGREESREGLPPAQFGWGGRAVLLGRGDADQGAF